jgi:hypothetical protein
MNVVVVGAVRESHGCLLLVASEGSCKMLKKKGADEIGRIGRHKKGKKYRWY